MPEEPQSPPEPEPKHSLYQRALRAMRDLGKRDIILGDVAAGATNVIIGKNNIQINVAGHKLTLPVWLIAIALTALVALLSWSFLDPILFPLNMSGEMNIAITEFGQSDSSGKIRESKLGNDLSKMVFEKLHQEYEVTYSTIAGTEGKRAEIWHDSQNEDGSRIGKKRPRLGFLTGTTPRERIEQASQLAGDIDADIVVYGNLVQEEDKRALQLEFYYAGGILREEPDAIVGRHVLSQLIPIPPNLEQEPMAVKTILDTPINFRARLIFWLTLALLFDVTDQQQRAFDTLLLAKESLKNWDDKNGQAVLHYFIGREAYWLRQYDVAVEALETAKSYREDYPSVYIGLAAIRYDRAQLYYLYGTIPEEQVECILPEELKRAVQSEAEVMQEIDYAIDELRYAEEIAHSANSQTVENIAILVLANAYRLKGQAYLLAAEHELAKPWFAKSLAEFARVEQEYRINQQKHYLAWTHLGMAGSYLLQAYVSQAEISVGADKATIVTKHRESAALFQQTEAMCQACLDEGMDVGNLLFQREVIRCGCEYLQNFARSQYEALQKLIEEQ